MGYFYAGLTRSLKPSIMTHLQMALYNIDYSHCYVRIPTLATGMGTDTCYHSTGSAGTHPTTMARALRGRVVVREWRIPTDGTNDEMLAWALDHIMGYGTLQMLGTGVAHALRPLLKLKRNPFADEKEEHCSMCQFRFIAHWASKITHPCTVHPSLVAPADMERFLAANFEPWHALIKNPPRET